MKYFPMIGYWFLHLKTKQNNRETYSNPKIVLAVPRMHSVKSQICLMSPLLTPTGTADYVLLCHYALFLSLCVSVFLFLIFTKAVKRGWVQWHGSRWWNVVLRAGEVESWRRHGEIPCLGGGGGVMKWHGFRWWTAVWRVEEVESVNDMGSGLHRWKNVVF